MIFFFFRIKPGNACEVPDFVFSLDALVLAKTPMNSLQPHLKLYAVVFFFSFPMPPHVLMNFRGFPPGCGDSVADF